MSPFVCFLEFKITLQLKKHDCQHRSQVKITRIKYFPLLPIAQPR